MKLSIHSLLLLTIFYVSSSPIQAQYDSPYDWWESASSGDWTGGSGRWRYPDGYIASGPTANRVLRFNNNNQTTTQNNVFSGFQIFQLIFGEGSTWSRTINGYDIVLNPEASISGNNVKIENYSSASHTLNIGISRGSGTGEMEINPVNGNLIFNRRIDNGGKIINVWGNNGKVNEFNDVIQGSGSFRMRQYSIVKFNAANSYTGTTEVHHGELWIMANGSISSSSSIWLGHTCCADNTTKLFLADGDGGQTFTNPINFNYGNARKQILGGLNSSGTNTFATNNISVPEGKTLTIEQVFSSGTLEFSSGISGQGSIDLVGAGTTLFTGENTYSGQTNVSGGTLRLNHSGGGTLPSSNSVYVTSGSTLRISTDQELNNLSVTNGSLIIDAGATLTISGTFTGGGTIINNGNLIIKGASSFPGSTSTISAMNNLEINRALGLTLDKSISITGNLTMTAGKLILGENNLTLSGTITGASTSNYIVTSGTGKLIKTLVNATSFTFPVGNTTYNPVTITNQSGATDEFTVRVIDAVYENGYSGTEKSTPRVNRTWDIGKTNNTAGAGINFTFQWDASQEQGTIANYRLNHFGSTWAFASGTSSAPTGTTTKTLTHTGYVGTFSPFSIENSATTLPVIWQQVDARCQDGSVLVEWSTGSEEHNSHFVVERNENATGWISAGSIPSSSNSSVIQHYQFRDNFSGTAQYRIRQVDLDGRSTTSRVIMVRCQQSDRPIRVYPNPAREQLYIQGASAGTRYQLFNNVGQMVQNGQIQTSPQQIILHSLPHGLYQMQLTDLDGKIRKERIQINR